MSWWGDKPELPTIKVTDVIPRRSGEVFVCLSDRQGFVSNLQFVLDLPRLAQYVTDSFHASLRIPKRRRWADHVERLLRGHDCPAELLETFDDRRLEEANTIRTVD